MNVSEAVLGISKSLLKLFYIFHMAAFGKTGKMIQIIYNFMICHFDLPLPVGYYSILLYTLLSGYASFL